MSALSQWLAYLRQLSSRDRRLRCASSVSQHSLPAGDTLLIVLYSVTRDHGARSCTLWSAAPATICAGNVASLRKSLEFPPQRRAPYTTETATKNTTIHPRRGSLLAHFQSLRSAPHLRRSRPVTPAHAQPPTPLRTPSRPAPPALPPQRLGAPHRPPHPLRITRDEVDLSSPYALPPLSAATSASRALRAQRRLPPTAFPSAAPAGARDAEEPTRCPESAPPRQRCCPPHHRRLRLLLRRRRVRGHVHGVAR